MTQRAEGPKPAACLLKARKVSEPDARTHAE